MTITERIRHLCDEQGVSFSTVERATGITSGNISRWDRSRPSVDAVAKVAAYLGTSVDYLIGASDAVIPADNELKFALFGGGGPVTDEMFEEVRQFARFVQEREKLRRFHEWERQQNDKPLQNGKKK